MQEVNQSSPWLDVRGIPKSLLPPTNAKKKNPEVNLQNYLLMDLTSLVIEEDEAKDLLEDILDHP